MFLYTKTVCNLRYNKTYFDIKYVYSAMLLCYRFFGTNIFHIKLISQNNESFLFVQVTDVSTSTSRDVRGTSIYNKHV